MKYDQLPLLCDLEQCYKSILTQHIKEGKIITRAEICKTISTLPAPRFYLTIDYARRIINDFARGKHAVRGKRKAMHNELYRRYMRIPAERRNINCLREIINSPAPGFYLSPHRINHLLYKFLKL